MKTVDILTALNYRSDYSGRIGAGLLLCHFGECEPKCAGTYALMS